LKSSRDKLIQAAIEAVYESGLHGVTTAKISMKASLSDAMIYKNFNNKDDLLVAAFLWIKRALNDRILSKLQTCEQFEEKCREVWYGHLDFFTNNPSYLAFIVQFEHSKYMTDELRQDCLSMLSSVIAIFEEGVKKGIFKDMEMPLVSILFFSPMLDLSEAIVQKRVEKSDDVLNLAYESILESLKM
jgi:AcrR family transcriptional regulator